MKPTVPPHAQRVVGRRRELGWTQADLAERIGVHRNTIARVEFGHWPADWLKLALAEALGEEPAVLFPLAEAAS